MSVTRESTIWCDGTNADGLTCGKWHQGMGSPSAVRAELKPRGWTRQGEQDFCREHSPERPSDIRRKKRWDVRADAKRRKS